MNQKLSSMAVGVTLSFVSALAFADDTVLSEEVIPKVYRPDVEAGLTQLLSKGALNERALMILSFSQKLSENNIKPEFQCAMSHVLEERSREVAGEILDSPNANLSVVTALINTTHSAETFSYLNGCEGAPSSKP